MDYEVRKEGIALISIQPGKGDSLIYSKTVLSGF